jgi:hypothetical protein
LETHNKLTENIIFGSMGKQARIIRAYRLSTYRTFNKEMHSADENITAKLSMLYMSMFISEN